MMRRISQTLWFLLAVGFLIEAWCWDHLEPIVARIVALIPLRQLKAWLAERISTLSPAMTLPVFLVPVAPLYPLKLFALALIAQGHLMAGLGIFLFLQVVGLGMVAFIFDVTKPKLLQLRWFAAVYRFVVELRDKAHALVAPTIAAIKARIASTLGGNGHGWGSRTLRMIGRLRRRAHHAR
ncbi:MAG TPA: hypothetical protein VGC77_20480 [Rhodopseudomonas sp.]|uniref:hypothetical protein n=1 Tax=Rhodopseudomonas sp. TaxID=1078 RepID=UPI002ED77767